MPGAQHPLADVELNALAVRDRVETAADQRDGLCARRRGRERSDEIGRDRTRSDEIGREQWSQSQSADRHPTMAAAGSRLERASIPSRRQHETA